MSESSIAEPALWAFHPGYWIWVLAMAVAFYLAVRWSGDRSAPDSGDPGENNWARQFCLIFDRFFGARHLTIDCFLRSCLASLVSVTALYLLFGPILGLLIEPAEEKTAFWKVLLIGAALNVLPDYLSLLETRWLLGKMNRISSVPGRLAVLAVDLLASAAITWWAITLFRLAAGEGKASGIAMLALFSPLSALFYSTFLASACAWVYGLSIGLARLAGRMRTGRSSGAEARPAWHIALVGSGIVLAAGLAMAPLLSPVPAADSDGRIASRLDTWLCRQFPFGAHLEGTPSSCVRAASQRIDEHNTEIAVELRNRCENDRAQACGRLGVMYRQGHGVDRNDAEAVILFRRACEGGSALGCADLGWMYVQGRGVGQNFIRAASLFRIGCDGEIAKACSNLGVLYEQGVGVERDDATAATASEFYRRGCEGGISQGCNRLGHMYSYGRGVAQNYSEAVTLYERSCETGDQQGCIFLGTMYSGGYGVAQNYSEAITLYERACAAGNPQGCSFLGNMYGAGYGVGRDGAEAVALYRRACDGGDAGGCFKLRLRYLSGASVAPDDPEALAFLRNACENGDSLACWTLGSRHHFGRGFPRDLAQAAARYRQACDFGLNMACDWLLAVDPLDEGL